MIFDIRFSIFDLKSLKSLPALRPWFLNRKSKIDNRKYIKGFYE